MESKRYTAEEALNLQSAAYQKGLNEGYELRKSEAQPAPRWVKASERLPEPDQRVMVYNEGLFLVFLKFWPAGFKNNDEPCFIDLNDKGPYGLDEITHWAPLPLGPDESAAGREEDAVAFAEWIRESGIEPTFGNKWVDFSKPKDNRHTTAELYELFKQQKEK